MSNVAMDLIWPQDPEILVRVVVLHVGQGASAIALVAEGDTYKTLLIDINLDAKAEGINVPRLITDLLSASHGHLSIFVNTHPHSDHLLGITELSTAVKIDEIWHSGHRPGKDHEDAYKSLQRVIREVKEAGGSETRLEGSRSPVALGDAECYVLAPAEYVVDDIEGESSDARNRRIHEQCAVLRLGKGATWIMLPGDADRDAWEKHIMYHEERLQSVILLAPHHGSRSFFHYDEEDEPYMEALEAVSPQYVVISAPRSDESQWGHPHQDAVKRYAKVVGEDNVLHTGDKRCSFICDIYRDGEYAIRSDNGKLAKAYPIDGSEDGGKEQRATTSAFIGTRVDHRPMG